MTQVYAADWVLPVGAPAVRNGAVAVGEDGDIVAVGARVDVCAAHPDAVIEDLGSAVLLPALVNAHTHLEYSGYGGFGDGLPFAAWLADHVARRPRLAEGDVEAAAALGALQCLQAGVGTIADASYSGAAVEAAATAGLRGAVCVEAFGGPDADAADVAARAADRVDALSASTSPILRVGISPHSPYTVAPHVFAALDALARERDLLVVTHVAESAAELEAVAAGTGPIAEALAGLTRVEATDRHPVDVLADAGLLHPGVLAVHLVQLDEATVRRFADTGAAAVHCPRSNALLGCGIAPVTALRRAGATVAVGTDSPASAIDLDLWSELRAAVFAARARERQPDALTAQDVIEMATLDGATALGLAGVVGRLAPGLRADLTAVDLTGTPWVEVEDPYVAALCAGSPSRTLLTVVDGVVRYRKGADDGRLAALAAAAAPGRRRMIGRDD